jgi:hypothetical protein
MRDFCSTFFGLSGNVDDELWRGREFDLEMDEGMLFLAMVPCDSCPMNVVATTPTPDPSHLILISSVYPYLPYDQLLIESYLLYVTEYYENKGPFGKQLCTITTCTKDLPHRNQSMRLKKVLSIY